MDVSHHCDTVGRNRAQIEASYAENQSLQASPMVSWRFCMSREVIGEEETLLAVHLVIDGQD
jgi:hypothetical protein